MTRHSGATLHQKVMVTGAGKSRTYGKRMEREPITGSRGRATGGGSGGKARLKLKVFGKTTSKYVHKFSTFTTHTVYYKLAADSVIGLRCVSCNIAELAAFWSPFQQRNSVKNFRLHVKKWWRLSPPLLKVVVSGDSHHRHIQSCAYAAPATAADQRLKAPAIHTMNNRKIVMAEFTATTRQSWNNLSIICQQNRSLIWNIFEHQLIEACLTSLDDTERHVKLWHLPPGCSRRWTVMVWVLNLVVLRLPL